MRMFARGQFGRIAGVLRQFRFELLNAFFQLGDTQQMTTSEQTSNLCIVFT
jgi:hypothetical protein